MVRPRLLILCFFLYLLGSLALFYHVGMLHGSVYFGQNGDPSLNVWSFRFFPQHLFSTHNPFVLPNSFAPYGANITVATATPLLALLAWPLTVIFGPVPSFNIVSLLAPALAALTCFLFVSSYTKQRITAFICGWIYGFSACVYAPLLGHLDVDFIAFLPLAFLLVRLRAKEDISFRAFVISLAVVTTCQFYVFLEDFTTEVIFLVIFSLATQVTIKPKNLLKMNTANIFFGVFLSYVLTAILASPYLFDFFRAHQFSLMGGWYGGADPLNYLFPTDLTLIGGVAFERISSHYPDNNSENLEYVGIVFFALACLAIWHTRKLRSAIPLTVLCLAGFVFSMGGTLWLLGLRTIWLPWALFEHLPLFENIIPSRMMPYPLLASLALICLFIDLLPKKAFAISALILSAIMMLPASNAHRTKGYWVNPVPTATLFESDLYKQFIPEHSTVFFALPGYYNGNPMFWQAKTGGWFKMVNGYGIAVPPQLSSDPAFKEFQSGKLTPAFPDLFNQFARAANISTVVIDQKDIPIWKPYFVKGGWKIIYSGPDLTLWNHPHP